MNTHWHAFWAYLLFHRSPWWPKAVLASLLPDLPFLFSAAFFFARDGIHMETWILAYEHPWVQPIGFSAHSLVIALLGLGVALVLQRRHWYPYFYGWLFHIGTDLFTHVSDAHPFLWPLSQMRFLGPVSYWESAHYSRELAIANSAVASLFAVSLLLRIRREEFDRDPRGHVFFSALFSLSLLGSGILAVGMGWLSLRLLSLSVIPGGLFFLVALTAYHLGRVGWKG
jgi:uncharacterized membrane protein YbaN (DUF454 family)